MGHQSQILVPRIADRIFSQVAAARQKRQGDGKCSKIKSPLLGRIASSFRRRTTRVWSATIQPHPNNIDGRRQERHPSLSSTWASREKMRAEKPWNKLSNLPDIVRRLASHGDQFNVYGELASHNWGKSEERPFGNLPNPPSSLINATRPIYWPLFFFL